MTHISDEDYKYAQTVWKKFGFKTFREYHNLYNLSDVLLLADVFENFRDMCIEEVQIRSSMVLYLPRFGLGCCIEVDRC